MDWVTERAKRDKAIVKNRQQIWDNLRTALQQAVTTFNSCYQHKYDAEFESQYPDHTWVRFRAEEVERAVHFTRTTQHTIRVETSIAGHPTTSFTLSLTVDSENNAVLAVDEKILTCEAISRIALEPVLFANQVDLFPRILENINF